MEEFVTTIASAALACATDTEPKERRTAHGNLARIALVNANRVVIVPLDIADLLVTVVIVCFKTVKNVIPIALANSANSIPRARRSTGKASIHANNNDNSGVNYD